MKHNKTPVLAAAVLLAAVILLAPYITEAAGGADVQRQAGTGIMGLVYSATEVLVEMLFFFIRPLMGLIEESLLANPEIYPLKQGGQLTQNGRIFRNIFIVLAPIYAMSVLILGAYMVFMSHSPRGRAQAKMMLDKIIVSMIVVPAAPAIYEILLQTSNIIARSVISTVLAETGKTSLASAFNSALAISTAPLWVIFLFSPHTAGLVVFWLGVTLLYVLWIALLMMWFRYLTVKVFAFLFPIILFMYLFEWTRHIGAMLLKYTLIWIFTPVISAVFLATGIFLVYSSPARVPSTFGSWTAAGGSGAISNMIAILLNPIFLTVTLALTWIAPLVMSGIMRVLGGIVSAVGMVVPGPYGMVLAAAGGVMQGKTMAELATVGIKYAGARSLKALKGTRAKSKASAAGATGEGSGKPKKPPGRLRKAAEWAGDTKVGRAAKWAAGTKIGRVIGRAAKEVAKNPVGASVVSAAKRGFGAVTGYRAESWRRMPQEARAAKEGAKSVRAGYGAARAQGKGRLRSAWEGAKAGASQFSRTRAGEGTEAYDQDRKKEKAKRSRSGDLRALENAGLISENEGAGLQAAGLTSASKIAKASDDQLAQAGVNKEKVGDLKGAAKRQVVDQNYMKELLGTAGYKQREPPGADLVDNADIPEEEGMAE